MFKKLLYVFLVVLALASCTKELPTPVISDVNISGITFTEGKAQVTVGQTITLSVECTNVDVSHYEWLVNNSIVGGEKQFVYTPTKRGVYQIEVKIYNLDNDVDNRYVGELTAVDPAPVVTCVHGGDLVLSTTKANDVPTLDGENMTISLTSDNVTISSYEWALNGKVIEGLSTGTYDLSREWSGTYDFEVKVFNQDNVSTTVNFTINLNGPYKEGVIFYGTTNEDLTFYNPSTSTYSAGNLFNAVNGTASIGKGGLNDLDIYNNKIYLLTPSSSSNKALITVADAQTYKVIKTIGAEGFNTTSLGEIYNLVVVNENKFYIGHNNSGGGNISGIGVLTVNAEGSASYTNTDIAGTSGQLGMVGPTWARMLRHGEYVLAACGNKVQVIDTNTDLVFKTISFDDDRQVCDIVKGRDGKIYVLVSGEEDKSSYLMWLWGMGTGPTSTSLVAVIDPTTFSKTSEKELLIGETFVNMKGGLSGCYAVASLTTDEIFFVQGGWGSKVIYKYNYSTQTPAVFATLPSVENGLSGYLGIDKDGILYIPTTNYTTSTVKTYDISTGTITTSPVSSRISGDAGITTTYRFQ